jgi:hypothetical protein
MASVGSAHLRIGASVSTEKLEPLRAVGMTLLFRNIGWMERYQGLRAGDQIVGGSAYVAALTY